MLNFNTVFYFKCLINSVLSLFWSQAENAAVKERNSVFH